MAKYKTLNAVIIQKRKMEKGKHLRYNTFTPEIIIDIDHQNHNL